MICAILTRLTAHLPAREIRGDAGEPYLERYRLGGGFGCAAYLHRFVASDPDRGLHDHPWGWSISVLLAGRYREIRPIDPHTGRGGERARCAGQVNIIRGGDFHRILIEPGRDTWTLFVHGPRVKGWGFLRNGEYRPIATDREAYPSHGWWKTAPTGAELRAVRGLGLWLLDDCEYVAAASAAEAVAWYEKHIKGEPVEEVEEASMALLLNIADEDEPPRMVSFYKSITMQLRAGEIPPFIAGVDGSYL